MDMLQQIVVMDNVSSIDKESDICSLHMYLNQHMDIYTKCGI